MSKIVAVGATALFACILCATPLSLRLSPEGNVALSRTALQRGLVVPSLQRALRA